MKDFFSTRRFKVLIVIAVFLAGMMAYAGANGRLTAAPQELLGVAAEPFQWAAAKLSSGVSGLWNKYARIDEVMAENESLKKENEALREQLVDYDRLQAENEAYQSLQGIQETHPDTTYVSSFVIGRDTLDSFESFTIDCGTASGIARGDAVVSDDGYLIGTVIEADATSSKILTILHPSFNAAGVVSRTRDNGILCGDSAYAAKGLCTFTNLTRETLATVGDEVITTGLGGVYPPDIMIGTITQILPEASGKTAVAVIQPGADIASVKHVFVITAY